MIYTKTPIQTRYDGFHFRSRLEARWAVFFDALDLYWDYEPEGVRLPDGICYLPDFVLPRQEFVLEVKPRGLLVADASDAVKKLACAAEHFGYPNYALLIGSPWHPIIEAYQGGKGTIDTDWFIGNRSAERIWAASDAAKSARFEHGEYGAT